MDLEALLAESSRRSTSWSISARIGDHDDAIFEHKPNQNLRTASVAKVFLLMEIAERIADGRLHPLRPVDRRSVPTVADSGLWQAMATDVLPLSDVAALVGAVSDNWATNALLSVVGLDSVQARAASVAPRGSTLCDVVRDERGDGVPDALSYGCAQDWASIMQGLHCGTVGGETERAYVLRWLSLDADTSMVAAAFDLDPLAHTAPDLGLRLWNKTGTDAGVRADIGVLQGPKAVVSYAVVCNWDPADTSAGTRSAALSAMRKIGVEVRRLAGESRPAGC